MQSNSDQPLRTLEQEAFNGKRLNSASMRFSSRECYVDPYCKEIDASVCTKPLAAPVSIYFILENERLCCTKL